MTHPLEKKVADLGRQVRRLVALYGLSRTVAIGVGVLVLLALADYLIHFEDRGIRAMASAAVVAVFVWTAYRFLFQPLAHRARDVQIAQRIERRFPQLKDRLSSSVQFLKQSEADPQAGSAALRRAVIVETETQLERLDLNETIERRPARRAASVACGVCLFAAALVLLDPQSSGLALARLARPFGSDAWPKVNQLEFQHPPDRVALGQPFEVELVDRNHHLPDEVRIHFRFEGDGKNAEETVEPMHLLNGVMTARKDNVSRPFKYRAEGGDDRSMPWLSLEVVEPPRVDSLSIKLYPPEYTGWPAETSERQIHALRGTRVEMQGTANKPLVSAQLVADGDVQVPAAVAADQYKFSLPGDPEQPFVIDKAGAYAIKLEDTEGVNGGSDDRWEIRAVPDQPPSVSIEQPATNVFVTRDAVVPLRIRVLDDLAVHVVVLHFNRSDRTDVEDIPVTLFTGPEKVAPSKTGLSGLTGDSRLVEHEWELAPLELKTGTQISFYATAADYSPQEGRSPVRRLTIISRQELEERIGQRQAVILGELRRVLKMQQEARGQVSSLEIQVGEVGRFGKPDVDHAQGAELNQRQVTRTLTSNTEGIPAQVKDLLAELASNKVDNPEVGRRMSGILREIDRLEKQELNVVERELTSAVKGAQAKLGADAREPDKQTSTDHAEFSRALTAAGEHQDQVVHSLEAMLGELTEWDGYRRFAQEVSQFRHEEEEIQQQTKQLGTQTLGKEAKNLDPQQQADLKKLSHRQSDLARRFDKVQQEMGEMTARMKNTDPLAASTLAEAVEQAVRQGISADMRQSSAQTEKNQVSQATQRQEQVNHKLDELLDILSNRREHELGQLVKKLREAEKQLSELRERQEGLRKKMAAAAKIADPEARKRELETLSKEEKQLEQEAQSMAHRLQRLQADKASRSMTSAATKLSRAGQAAEKGDGEKTDEQADQAKKDLDDAQQQLAQRRKQAEADLAQEQLAQMEDALKGLHQRQQNVLAETERLEGLRPPQGQFKREQAAAVQQQAREQKSLGQEAGFLAEKLTSAEVFQLALSNTVKQMNRAAGLLARSDTGAAAQRAEQNATDSLARLLEALKKDTKAGKANSGGGGGGGGDKKKAENTRSLAELKLLELLQRDLNQRFEDLAENKSDDPDDNFAELARKQGEMAELLSKLLEVQEEAPEDNPEKLPVIRDGDLPDDAEAVKKAAAAGDADDPPAAEAGDTEQESDNE